MFKHNFIVAFILADATPRNNCILLIQIAGSSSSLQFLAQSLSTWLYIFIHLVLSNYEIIWQYKKVYDFWLSKAIRKLFTTIAFCNRPQPAQNDLFQIYDGFWKWVWCCLVHADHCKRHVKKLFFPSNDISDIAHAADSSVHVSRKAPNRLTHELPTFLFWFSSGRKRLQT